MRGRAAVNPSRDRPRSLRPMGCVEVVVLDDDGRTRLPRCSGVPEFGTKILSAMAVIVDPLDPGGEGDVDPASHSGVTTTPSRRGSWSRSRFSRRGAPSTPEGSLPQDGPPSPLTAMPGSPTGILRRSSDPRSRGCGRNGSGVSGRPVGPSVRRVAGGFPRIPLSDEDFNPVLSSALEIEILVLLETVPVLDRT